MLDNAASSFSATAHGTTAITAHQPVGLFPTCAGLMKARRPGVSAVLLEEYAAGVNASSSKFQHSGTFAVSWPHTFCATSASLKLADVEPRERSRSALLLLIL
jgi:hypothetical protein